MEYKYVIRYCIWSSGKRKTLYFANVRRSYTTYKESDLKRTAKIGEAILFDTEEEATMMLRNPEVRAGMAKVIPISEKEVFQMKLKGK